MFDNIQLSKSRFSSTDASWILLGRLRQTSMCPSYYWLVRNDSRTFYDENCSYKLHLSSKQDWLYNSKSGREVFSWLYGLYDPDEQFLTGNKARQCQTA